MIKLIKHFTFLLSAIPFLAIAGNHEPTQTILISNNTNQALTYNLDIYHEVYEDNPDHHVIQAHSSQSIHLKYDFYWGDNRDPELNGVFCALHKSGDRTNCSSFIIDIYPNLTKQNNDIKENPMTIRFQGDTPAGDGEDTMTAIGFNNADSNYTMTYGYNCTADQSKNVDAGMAVTYGTNTSDSLCNFDININTPRILTENSKTPTIKTTLVAPDKALESGGFAQSENLYDVNINYESQHGVTPPLNGFFYQVKEASGKIDYFYPTTGLLYNQDGTISPNSFDFYLRLPSTDKSYQVSACTSDFISDSKSPDIPICHHSLWSKVIPLPQNTHPWQYKNGDNIRITPLNAQESLYNNGSYALPVAVTIYDNNNTPLPTTDSAYNHLFFVDTINKAIINNNVFNTNAIAIIPADIAWLQGLFGTDNYAAKYTSNSIMRRLNNGKLYYIYTSSPTNLNIAADMCEALNGHTACISNLSELAGTSFLVKPLSDDKNTISTNNETNPAVLRHLSLNKESQSLAPECGNLENPNTPALNYIMSHWALPNTADAIPNGAYYLLPGMSACTLSHGLFCTDGTRGTENSSTLYRFYLEDVSNGTVPPITHINNQLWAKYLLLSDQYDYSNPLTGDYHYSDQAQHDHAVLFDNCGIANLYQMHQDNTSRNTGDTYKGAIIYNDFSYPIVLRSIDTSTSQDNLHSGTGVTIFAHHSIVLNGMNNTQEELEADSLSGIKLFNFELYTSMRIHKDDNSHSSDSTIAKLRNCSVSAYLQLFTLDVRFTYKLYLMPNYSDNSIFQTMYKNDDRASSSFLTCHASQPNTPKKPKQAERLATKISSMNFYDTNSIPVVLMLKNTNQSYDLQSALYKSKNNQIITKKPDNLLFCVNGPFPLFKPHLELPEIASIEGYQDNAIQALCEVFPDKEGNYQLVITKGNLLHPDSMSTIDVKKLTVNKIVSIDPNLDLERTVLHIK
ncbi:MULTISPECIES: hypothetical protein [Cysteiniphilum]|uniref:hypothetical protein n=1 Tax=Cysteiniphilum TaxID=2056696 RepID=UPI001783EDBB|nr:MULTISPECIES: hypothetical protein [Cysteiniphilum]